MYLGQLALKLAFPLGSVPSQHLLPDCRLIWIVVTTPERSTAVPQMAWFGEHGFWPAHEPGLLPFVVYDCPATGKVTWGNGPPIDAPPLPPHDIEFETMLPVATPPLPEVSTV